MVTQTKKPAYQRPYKSRNERRKADLNRSSYDDNQDNKFLLRVAVAVGLVLMLALGFAIKGLIDRESTSPASHSSAQEAS